MCIRDSAKTVPADGVFSANQLPLCPMRRAARLAIPRCANRAEAMSVTLHAVSYTHLDVYKRQMLGQCVQRRLNPRAIGQPRGLRADLAQKSGAEGIV